MRLTPYLALFLCASAFGQNIHWNQILVSDRQGAGAKGLSNALTSAHFFIGNGSGVAADVALSGDASVTNAGVWTNLKLNGISFAASPSTNTLPIITAANTASWSTLPDCQDSSGNHLNYNNTTHALSCGTSVPAISLTSGVTGILPIANGGSGTSTPALVAGSNVTITGSWPNQTIAASGSGGTLPAYIQPSTAVPTVASLTAVNQSTSTAVDSVAGIFMHQLTSSTAYVFALLQNAPSAPWTFTAALTIPIYPTNFMHAGLCFSDGTKITTFGPQYNGGMTMAGKNWTNANTYSSDVMTALSWPNVISSIFWLRLKDDNTNRLVSYSFDGVNFIPLPSATVGRTTFQTATKLGACLENNAASLDSYMTVSSWLVTTP